MKGNLQRALVLGLGIVLGVGLSLSLAAQFKPSFPRHSVLSTDGSHLIVTECREKGDSASTTQ